MKDEKIAIIYHRVDFDGVFSGAIILKKYPNAKLIGWNHGDEIPNLDEFNKIIMCDISFDKKNMLELFERLKNNLIIIDHHKSFIDSCAPYTNNKLRIPGNEKAIVQLDSNNKLIKWFYCLADAEREMNIYYEYIAEICDGCENLKKGGGFKWQWLENYNANCFEGLREVGMSACELCWEYYNDEKIPLAVTLAGRFDVWDLDYENDLIKKGDVMKFQKGLSLIEKSPKKIYDLFLNKKSSLVYRLINSTIIKGELIYNYLKNEDKQLCKSKAFFIEFEGYKAVCLNIANRTSEVFDSINISKYDIAIRFSYNKKGYSYSITTEKDNIDVSKIALKYEGGGHQKAAGFRSDKLLLAIEKEKVNTNSFNFLISLTDSKTYLIRMLNKKLRSIRSLLTNKRRSKNKEALEHEALMISKVLKNIK